MILWKEFQRVTPREIKKDILDYSTFNCIDKAYTDLTAALLDTVN